MIHLKMLKEHFKTKKIGTSKTFSDFKQNTIKKFKLLDMT